MNTITDMISGKNLMLSGAVFAVVASVKTVAPSIQSSKVGQRLLPILPVILGALAALAGFCDVALAPRWQDRVVVGILSGAFSGHFFKMGKTSLLGMDLDDVAAPAAPAVPAAPPPPPASPEGGA